MATSPVAAAAPSPAPAPEVVERAPSRPKAAWQKFGTPLIILLLAVAVIVTITRNWNAWEGGHVEQVTNDAYVRGDLTPLSTTVPCLVREVKVNDYQQVHKGDLLVQLDDDDFKAQLAQAAAGVEAAKAALENNRRQRDLQDAKIDRAQAGVDQAKAQIVAAQAGKDATDADVTRTRVAAHRRCRQLVQRSACSPDSLLRLRARLAWHEDQQSTGCPELRGQTCRYDIKAPGGTLGAWFDFANSRSGTTSTGQLIPTTNGYAFGFRHQRLEWHGGYHVFGIQYGTGAASNFSTSIDDPSRFVNSTARFLLTEQVLFQPNEKFANMLIFILQRTKDGNPLHGWDQWTSFGARLLYQVCFAGIRGRIRPHA